MKIIERRLLISLLSYKYFNSYYYSYCNKQENNKQENSNNKENYNNKEENNNYNNNDNNNNKIKILKKNIKTLQNTSLLNNNNNKENKESNKESNNYYNSYERQKYRNQMINKYIYHLLNDPQLHRGILGDKIARRLYEFTIKLTLNSILTCVNYLDGVEIFGHHIELQYNPNEIKLPLNPINLDRKPIDEFVKKLLKDPRVNIRGLPDFLEHEIYVTCFLLIFTVLQSFLDTTKLELLRHHILINMSPDNDDQTKYNSLCERIQFHKENISEAIIEKIVVEILESERNNPFIPDFLERKLYRTLYALILSLLEEIFRDMNINIIGDKITFKLKPGSKNKNSVYYLPDNNCNNEHNNNYNGNGNGDGDGDDGTNDQSNYIESFENSENILNLKMDDKTSAIDDLRQRYNCLLLEEKISKQILLNIQRKKIDVKNELSRLEPNSIVSFDDKKILSDASSIGLTFFISSACVGLIYFVLKGN